ncbi:MAG TPA: DUF1116 domain-containing protein [Chloroflexota bacterium]|jgi:hypothetical protein
MTSLLATPLHVVNVGLDLFADQLAARGVPVERVAWRPPLDTLDGALAGLLADPRVDAANATAVARLLGVRPVLVDVRPAAEVVPGLGPRMLVHAGPPIGWDRMCGPLRGAVVGAVLFEGWADTPQAAETMAAAGEFEFAPCHDHAAVGPMAGLVSPSMPVYVVRDAAGAGVAHATLNEGLGKVLRYGAYSAEVLDRLRWMRDGLGPALGASLRAGEPVDLRRVFAEAVQMGDECHNRNKAATSLLFRELAPRLVESGQPSALVAQVLRFVAGNDHFALNLSMAAGKLAAAAATDVPGSTLVTTMARNGTDFGIRVSGLRARWFTGPAQVPEGLYFAGYGEADANPDIGDSAITETTGLGGFAMAAAPAIVQFVGGTPADAIAYTRTMYEITLAEHDAYRIPALDFRGTPVGIDVRRVLHTGVLPVINTGIAHREPGVGQIGAGIVRPPAECFVAAGRALRDTLA